MADKAVATGQRYVNAERQTCKVVNVTSRHVDIQTRKGRDAWNEKERLTKAALGKAWTYIKG